MSLVVFQHRNDEPAACLGAMLQSHGHRLRVIDLSSGGRVPVDLDDVDGVVSMGGPMNVDEADRHPWLTEEANYLKAAHDAGKPVVGVCLGAQLIAQALGGQVAPMQQPEAGWADVKLAFPGTIDAIYIGIPWTTPQYHLHGQEVTDLPPDATPLAGSAQCRNQAFKVGMTTYGFQYHFEWDYDQCMHFGKDACAKDPDVEPARLHDDTNRNFDRYRHLADRLCRNIATYLFATG